MILNHKFAKLTTKYNVNQSINIHKLKFSVLLMLILKFPTFIHSSIIILLFSTRMHKNLYNIIRTKEIKHVTFKINYLINSKLSINICKLNSYGIVYTHKELKLKNLISMNHKLIIIVFQLYFSQ